MIRRRLILAGSVLLLAMLAAIGAALHYAAYTSDGLQFIAAHVPQRIGRAQLAITAPSGTLAHGFEIARIEIEHERTHLIFEGIRGRLAIAPLLWQTIDVRDATLRHAFVQVRKRTRPVKKYTPRFLPAGLVVRVDGARVESAALIATNGRRFDTSHLQASGAAHYRTLRLFDTSFDWEAMHVTGDATLQAADPMRIAGAARVSIAWPNQPIWVINATGVGDLNSLALEAHFTAPFRADFKGHALELTRGWNWRGETRVHDFDLRAWGGGDALGRITGTLAMRGNSQGFSARGPLTPAGLQAGAFETLFEGSYANRVVTAERIELQHPSGAVMRGAGSIGLVSNGPRLDLGGTWRDFRWPLVGQDVAVRSAKGTYTLTGVWPYDWQAAGPLIAKSLAAMPVEAQGRLAKDRVFLDAVSVAAFAGNIDLHGEVLWAPDERWAVNGHASGVNPGELRADLPGKLDFDFEAGGLGFGGTSDYSVAMHDLKGQLRKVAASGGGKLARRGGAWELDAIRLGLGRTQISADGCIAREVDLRFTVNAADLSLLAEGSRGQLRAQGTVLGSPEDPVITATLQGSGINHAGIGLGELNGTIDFDARNTRPSKIDLRARNLAYGHRAVSLLTFRLNGTAAAHVARLNATAGALAIDTLASGAFAHGKWQGQLSALSLNSNGSLHLALDAPAPLRLSAQRLQVNAFCLSGQPARICAEADWTAAKWAAVLNARDLPLATLTSGLTREVDYRGSVTVDARAFGGGGQPMQGNLRANLGSARIVHRLASGRLQSILLGSGSVTAQATTADIEARVELDAGRIGTIKGRAAVARGTPRWQDMPLLGELQVQTAELGFVTLYAPQIDRAAGRLMADLSLGGTAGTPLVNGILSLTEAELDQYQVNLALRGATLEAQLHGTGLSFKGSARIGKGEARSSGQLAWRDALPYGKFHLEGENLRVADVPEAQIDASPNLDFNLQGRRIAVSGAVTVPYARIVPTDLQNAVRASGDEVLVGAKAHDPSKQFEVVTDIKLTLADRVSIETSGLTGRLEGGLAVRSGYDEMTSGVGELSIQEGKYIAYGRKLDIQRGRLIFTGGPVENPGVDIRAIKQFPDVIAGVNVRGTLQQPRLTFFSEPSMPQQQIVSLILAGGSLGAVQQNRQTGNEILAQGGAILAQQLGAKVGIEDVSVESDLDNETSLVLGKYLSPRLYVSYGISLAESINTMKLRYSLNDHWTIRSEVGEARSADLVYTIEK